MWPVLFQFKFAFSSFMSVKDYVNFCSITRAANSQRGHKLSFAQHKLTTLEHCGNLNVLCSHLASLVVSPNTLQQLDAASHTYHAEFRNLLRICGQVDIQDDVLDCVDLPNDIFSKRVDDFHAALRYLTNEVADFDVRPDVVVHSSLYSEAYDQDDEPVDLSWVMPENPVVVS